MKNVVDFPDTAAIDDQAAAWLVRLDSDDPLSDDERARMAEWLQRSPAHRERLLELAELWEKLNALTELAVPLAPSSPTGSRAPRRWLPAVGAVGVAAAAVAAFFVLSPPFDTPPITETNGLYSSAIGEQRSTVLVDGSEIVLNTNSQIKVDYDEEYRDVRLMQGEALFVVAKDEQRRFRVFAGGGRIDAVGTAFSVYLKDDAVDITVTEGEVAVSSVTPAVSATPQTAARAGAAMSTATNADLGTLRAGQIATLPRLDETSADATALQLRESRSVQEQELRRRMSWTDGRLRFQNEPLERVVSEISRYTTVKVEFADPELRSEPMYGVFPVGETELMFETLEVYGFEVTYLSANRVRISAGE